MNNENNTEVTQTNNEDTLVLVPNTDVYESKEGVVLYVDLPGVKKDNLDIDIDKDVLSIKGKVSLNISPDMKPTYVDIKADVFERRFTLSDELDSEAIDAKLEQGLLKLSIPRQERHKPKKIEIKVA